jgi:hypothetical protein
MKGWWGKALKVLGKFSSIPVIIAALTAIDQLRGAREVMRAAASYLRDHFSVPQEVLDVLDSFRKFFEAVAHAIFFWVPENIQSMLLVATILFGEAVIYYLIVAAVNVVKVILQPFGQLDEKSIRADLRTSLGALDSVGELIKESSKDYPAIKLDEYQVDALRGRAASAPIGSRITNKEELETLVEVFGTRVREDEAELEKVEDAIKHLRATNTMSKISTYLRSRPPRIPVYKYAFIVGTLVLCIAVNYVVYPMSEYVVPVELGDPLRDFKIDRYIEHKKDYDYHVTLALVYSLPVVAYIVVTFFMATRDLNVGPDMRAALISAPILFVAGVWGWDARGILSPALCLGFSVSMYVVAMNVFFIRRFSKERSWLTQDMRRREQLA